MDTKLRTIHSRLGGVPAHSNVVCHFWKMGKCNRNPCRFMHRELPSPVNVQHGTSKHASFPVAERPKKRFDCGRVNNSVDSKQSSCSMPEQRKRRFDHGDLNNNSLDSKQTSSSIAEPPKRIFDHGNLKDNSLDSKQTSTPVPENPKRRFDHSGVSNNSVNLSGNCEDKRCVIEVRKKTRALRKCPENPSPSHAGDVSEDKTTEKSSTKTCEHWMKGSCVKGDECQFLHSWFDGDWFSMVTKLKGHNQAVSGIALPSGSDKLYSGSSDGTMHVWDCHTGQSANMTNLGDKIGTLISEGPWIFVGLSKSVKVWNLETGAEFSLNEPVGQVNAMVTAVDMLFAGVQDGAILAWKGRTETPMPFQLIKLLKGHTGAVTCLAVSDTRLFSGSMDSTIRVWDITSLECIHTIYAHVDAVMSLTCWKEYLLSCSLDHTIKVWATTEGGNLEMTYTHNEKHRPIALSGICDTEAKPVLFCSCNDNSVHLYDLPSFKERGRILSKREIRTIHIGPFGLFFTGDGTGMVTVWKLTEIEKGV